jgi:cold shock protein
MLRGPQSEMSDLDLAFSYQDSQTEQSRLWSSASMAIQAEIDGEKSPQQLIEWFRQVQSRLFKINDDLRDLSRSKGRAERERDRYVSNWSAESWSESDRQINRLEEFLSSYRASKRCCDEILSWIKERQSALKDLRSQSSGVVVEASKTGVVRSWNAEKGFGFVRVDGSSSDVFIHQSALVDATGLMKGQRVVLVNIAQTERGLRASRVHIA